jgi:hypothetical protein
VICGAPRWSARHPRAHGSLEPLCTSSPRGWAPDPGVDVEDEADAKLCDGTGVPERRIFGSVDLQLSSC